MISPMLCLSKPLFECKNPFHMQDDNTVMSAMRQCGMQVVLPLRLNFDGEID